MGQAAEKVLGKDQHHMGLPMVRSKGTTWKTFSFSLFLGANWPSCRRSLPLAVGLGQSECTIQGFAPEASR